MAVADVEKAIANDHPERRLVEAGVVGFEHRDAAHGVSIEVDAQHAFGPDAVLDGQQVLAGARQPVDAEQRLPFGGRQGREGTRRRVDDEQPQRIVRQVQPPVARRAHALRRDQHAGLDGRLERVGAVPEDVEHASRAVGGVHVSARRDREVAERRAAVGTGEEVARPQRARVEIVGEEPGAPPIGLRSIFRRRQRGARGPERPPLRIHCQPEHAPERLLPRRRERPFAVRPIEAHDAALPDAAHEERLGHGVVRDAFRDHPRVGEPEGLGARPHGSPVCVEAFEHRSEATVAAEALEVVVRPGPCDEPHGGVAFEQRDGLVPLPVARVRRSEVVGQPRVVRAQAQRRREMVAEAGEVAAFVGRERIPGMPPRLGERVLRGGCAREKEAENGEEQETRDHMRSSAGA